MSRLHLVLSCAALCGLVNSSALVAADPPSDYFRENQERACSGWYDGQKGTWFDQSNNVWVNDGDKTWYDDTSKKWIPAKCKPGGGWDEAASRSGLPAEVLGGLLIGGVGGLILALDNPSSP